MFRKGYGTLFRSGQVFLNLQQFAPLLSIYAFSNSMRLPVLLSKRKNNKININLSGWRGRVCFFGLGVIHYFINLFSFKHILGGKGISNKFYRPEIEKPMLKFWGGRLFQRSRGPPHSLTS